MDNILEQILQSLHPFSHAEVLMRYADYTPLGHAPQGHHSHPESDKPAYSNYMWTLVTPPILIVEVALVENLQWKKELCRKNQKK